jgi:hypothetical protein
MDDFNVILIYVRLQFTTPYCLISRIAQTVNVRANLCQGDEIKPTAGAFKKAMTVTH